MLVVGTVLAILLVIIVWVLASKQNGGSGHGNGSAPSRPANAANSGDKPAAAGIVAGGDTVTVTCLAAGG
jgi:hypothetical protein